MVEGIKLSQKADKTVEELKQLGNIKIPVFKKDVNYYQVDFENLLYHLESIFYADYGTTTFQQISQAILNNKTVFLNLNIDENNKAILHLNVLKSDTTDKYIFSTIFDDTVEKKLISCIVRDDDAWSTSVTSFSSLQNKKIKQTISAPNEATEWNPTIEVNNYVTLDNITSSMTSLIIKLSSIPDNTYMYEHSITFTTPETLGIVTFSVIDYYNNPIRWIGESPSLEANKTYEISVVNGIGVIGSVV